ncbi:MAG: CBS domain-containing protein [Phycisphaerales bacterium]|nr:MAG: CBS domain-containing protein [Phycisphaerales bacterium]
MSLRDNLTQDAVQALRVLEPVTLGPRGTVADAVALMQEHAAGCVFVTEEDRPVGIVTERDVLTKVLAWNLSPDTPIAEVMTSPPEVIQEGCPVIEVIRRMDRGGFRHMPVVNESDKLQGVVSVKRVVEYLVEYFPSAVFNVPPESVQRRPTREGA